MIAVLPNLSTGVRAFDSILLDFRTVKDDYRQHINILFVII